MRSRQALVADSALSWPRCRAAASSVSGRSIAEQGIPILPQNLSEAVAAFAGEPVLREAIGENLAQEFIRLKNMEWVEYSRHVSAWETNRYLEFF